MLNKNSVLVLLLLVTAPCVGMFRTVRFTTIHRPLPGSNIRLMSVIKPTGSVRFDKAQQFWRSPQVRLCKALIVLVFTARALEVYSNPKLRRYSMFGLLGRHGESSKK